MMENRNRPFGLNVLIGLLTIGCFGILYYTFVNTSFRIVGLILTPIWIYMATGLYKGWNHSRLVCIFVFAIWFILALLNVGLILFTDFANEIGHVNPQIALIRSSIRALLLPLVIIYLYKKDVRAYFKNAPGKLSQQDAVDGTSA